MLFLSSRHRMKTYGNAEQFALCSSDISVPTASMHCVLLPSVTDIRTAYARFARMLATVRRTIHPSELPDYGHRTLEANLERGQFSFHAYNLAKTRLTVPSARSALTFSRLASPLIQPSSTATGRASVVFSAKCVCAR